MAESSETVSLQEPHLQKQYQHALDPISLLLSNNLNSGGCYYILERGPRYRAYAELRESKLRSRRRKQPSRENEENVDPKDPKLTPPKKQVKFQVVMGNSSSSSSSSILAQSVPDFSSALRKENRKPIELTPPPPQSKAWSRSNVAGSNAKGSKSANAGEKKGGLARKSCVSLEELKGFSSAAGNAINGGDDRVIRGRVTGRNVFGFRKF